MERDGIAPDIFPEKRAVGLEGGRADGAVGVLSDSVSDFDSAADSDGEALSPAVSFPPPPQAERGRSRKRLARNRQRYLIMR
jgi:hypothetical protein